MKIDNGTGGSRETSPGGLGSRPGRSAVHERGRESINFFSELKRRNVYKVAVAYAVVGWLLVQIATQVFPFFEIPNWAVRLVVLIIIVGFPIALVIAWAFEMTPEGIKRTGAASDAIAILGRLLTIPAGETVSIARLKIDPVWDPIRKDPAFQQLLTAKEYIGQ
jgi:hypothetical protein